LAVIDHNVGFVEWIVLNAEANVEVDPSALGAPDELREKLARKENRVRDGTGQTTPSRVLMTFGPGPQPVP